VLEHDQFEEVREGMRIPDFYPQYTVTLNEDGTESISADWKLDEV
jgi:hypothetical protein